MSEHWNPYLEELALYGPGNYRKTPDGWTLRKDVAFKVDVIRLQHQSTGTFGLFTIDEVIGTAETTVYAAED